MILISDVIASQLLYRPPYDDLGEFVPYGFVTISNALDTVGIEMFGEKWTGEEISGQREIQFRIELACAVRRKEWEMFGIDPDTLTEQKHKNTRIWVIRQSSATCFWRRSTRSWPLR